MTVESAFLTSIRSMDDYMWVISRGVNGRHFDINRASWDWLVAYINRTATVPPLELLRKQIPDFDVADGTVGDVRFHFDELHKAYIGRTIKSTVFRVADDIQGDPVGALDSIIRSLIDVQRTESPNFSYFDKDARERMESLVKRREELSGDDISGIPTGIEILDIQRYGWQRGEFSAFIARPGAGKTELLALSAVTAMTAKRRVLVVSAEMTREKFMLRMDPILARQKGIPLADFPSNRQLVSGRITDELVGKYGQYIDSLVESDAVLVVDQQGRRRNFTVEEIASVARNHRADLVIIDGIKLLSGEQGRNTSSIDRYASIVKDCHDLAQSEGFVILGAEHTARVVESNKMPEMNQVFNGETIPQFAERIITMMVPTGQPHQRYISVQKARDGGGVPRRKTISFNPDIGDVGRWIDPMDVKLQSELAEFVVDAPVTAMSMVGEAVSAAMTELDLG